MADLKELRIDYSISMRANFASFEGAEARIGRSETWDVSQMTPEEADAFYSVRYEAVQKDCGDKVAAKYKAIHGNDI